MDYSLYPGLGPRPTPRRLVEDIYAAATGWPSSTRQIKPTKKVVCVEERV
jgi:hypothetical protein